MKLLILTAVLLLCAGCSWFQRDSDVHYCPPDNKPVVVYRDPTKSYQPYVTQVEGGFEGLKTTLKQVDTDIGIAKANVKTKIESLEQKLNQESIRLRLNLQTVALAFNVSPCDTQTLLSQHVAQMNNTLTVIFSAQNDLQKALSNSEGKSDEEKNRIYDKALDDTSRSLENIEQIISSPESAQKKNLN